MNGPDARRLALLVLLVLAVAAGRLMVASAEDQPLEFGPHTVILCDLEDAYEPVPFDHLSHAKMAQMWHGCVTCHHYSPQPGDGSTTATLAGVAMHVVSCEDTATTAAAMRQEDSIQIPACKSCHPIEAGETDIHMPSLKGAYHRQCLNCHKDWMHENGCVICHEPKEGRDAAQAEPLPGDIVGRMHPPIPEPDITTYKMRFTPADGGNVTFRHREHTVDFGIRCVECHYQDNCAHCHGPSGDTTALKPVHPGMTWDESHGPCMACHSQARCRHCHYKDDQSPPNPFSHTATGQELDQDHAEIACAQCHEDLGFDAAPTCGDAACHKDQTIGYPAHLPGPVATPVPDSFVIDAESSGTAVLSTGNDGP